MTNRDYNVLSHIVGYCREIAATAERFGPSYEFFLRDSVYKNAVALCVLQIGELSGQLSDSFKEEHDMIPWRDIKAMRNVVAHHYGKIDEETLFETMIQDIPDLQDYCEKILFENDLEPESSDPKMN